MKFAGKKIVKNQYVLPIIRGEVTQYIVLNAVSDPDLFEKICPEPQPQGSSRKPGEASVPDYSAKSYVDARNEWSKQRWRWLLLEGLKATPELEFETVDIANPDTWKNIEDEFKESGMTKGEYIELIQAVYMVNGLDEDKVKEARESFFRTVSEAALALSSQTAEQQSS